MFAAYVTMNIVAAVFAAVASVTYLIRLPYTKAAHERKRLPLSWMPRLGITLAAGSLGLLAGFALPAVGTLASLCLVLYFVGAFICHFRVGSRDLAGPIVFFVTMAATFVVNLAYHGLW